MLMIAVVFIFGVVISSLLTVGLLTGSFKLKQKISKMDEEAWARYMQSITRKRMVRRLWICFLGSVLVVSFAVRFMFAVLKFAEPTQMTIIFVVFAALYAGLDFAKNYDALAAKLSILKK